MNLALLPAARAIEKESEPPAAPEVDLTPQELIRAAERAYAAADWPAAESRFATLIETYRTIPELAETVRRARPLWVTARLRLKKFDAETLALLVEVLTDPKLDPSAADELRFWRALCHIHSGAFAEARQSLGEYMAGNHLGSNVLPPASLSSRATRRAEAVLLNANCLLQENHAVEAAAFLAPHIQSLRQQKLPEAAGRAVVLRLHALIAVGDDQAALTLVRENQPRLAEITQLAAFHTLTLQLGSRLLENGHHHDAIICFQRVWPRDQILSHQKSAQARFSHRLAVARQTPGQETAVFPLECLLNRLEKEVEIIGKIEHFDSALRFRIAAAYRELGRPREAALILEDMLTQLPADAVVENASLCLIQCWIQVENWPRAVAAAEAYLENYKRPENVDVPLVRFLKASALHADHQALEAELAFATVHQLHADHELAPRALFLEGICLLEQDLNREALDAFTEVAQRFPQCETTDDAVYWSAMALSFEKRHADARDRMHSYLKTFGSAARHANEARFRIAFSTFGLADYPAAVTQLGEFISMHAGEPLVEEAKLLLGDALGALGRIDDAVAAYRSVDRALNPRFHEDAVFRIGNAFKISEQPEAQRTHFERFLSEHPESRRLAEAVYWIGQSHQKSGKPEAARDAYWKVLAEHGNNPNAAGIEDILEALPKMYSGAEARDQLISQLNALAEKSSTGQPTFALRLRWAEARLRTKSMPEQARVDMAGLASQLQPRHHHPRITADCADALRECARPEEARSLYLELRKWHPRALEKDRAFLGLGMIALESRQSSEALEYFARFERESLGSPLQAEVARLKAGLFEERQCFKEAQAEYEKLLELPTASRQAKARALIQLGDLMAHQNQDLKSTAYYERVYVSYGKYRPEVASAYAKRAAALERLGEPKSAAAVWRELAERDDLAGFSQSAKARQRLAELDPTWVPRVLPDDHDRTLSVPASTVAPTSDALPTHPTPPFPMNPRMLLFLVAATAWGAPDLPSRPVVSDPAWPSTVSLVNGAVVRCRIRSATTESLVIEYPRVGAAVAAAVRREVRWSEIRSAEFVMDDEFYRLTASRDSTRDTPRLAERWQQISSMVSRPNHPAGELGLSLARLSLDHPDTGVRRRIVEVCRAIAGHDWNKPRRHQARLLLAQILASLGRKDEALSEARRLASETGIQPEAAMAAQLMLANHDFASLRALEGENPMWRDDDTVRPEREALFHRALEAALKPSLFHGALEGPATLGLWTAVQILEFAGQLPAAAECARDLLRLYPGSASAAEAVSFLGRHRLTVHPAPPAPDPPAQAANGPAPSAPSPTNGDEPAVHRRPRYADDSSTPARTPPKPNPSPSSEHDR